MSLHAALSKSPWILAAVVSLALSPACTRRSEQPQAAAAQPRSNVVEALEGQVPSSFSEAAAWNRPAICPEGAELSPLMRYTYEPGQQAHGFKHYFGRSCNITLVYGETSERTPASPHWVSTVPHGPFIWWYENGKRMSAGTFERGALATDWARWEPDGSLAAK
jgi:hypothetical protein